MKFQQEKLDGEAIIQGYDSTGIRINGQTHTESVIFGTDLPPCPWPGAHPDQFAVEQAQYVIEQCETPPEVLLVGTGPNQRFPAPSVRRLFLKSGWPVEFMDTFAACRTYNILVGEGRKTLAALLLTIG